MTASVSSVSPPRTTCASLLHELQIIWDEIGESDHERDQMLLQLEHECLDIYRKKVDVTRKHKADLNQALANGEAEISEHATSLGDNSSFSRVKGTLKQQISSMEPILDQLRSKKQERIEEFYKAQLQIAEHCAEIAGNVDLVKSSDLEVDESDLTGKRLAELEEQLKELQNEKSLRLHKVSSSISKIYELSVVMSHDFSKAINDVHPSLINCTTVQSRSISNETLSRLSALIHSMKHEKQQRLQKLQDLASTLIELWNLLDISMEEKKCWNHVATLISSSADDISEKGSLAADVIEQVEIEVGRLKLLKASKMKELVFKRQNELEEIYRGVHMDVDSSAARQILVSLIESGNVDLSDLLSSMDDQIMKAKEQAQSRKDILDKVEKWQMAFEEEKWLDDYEKDENRYTAGRGAHKSLKRAEKARIMVSKIPSMVEMLTSKVNAWELEKGIPFLYDKLPLLHALEEHSFIRHEREEEKRRSREHKKLQEQFAAEQEALYGSKPTKKPLGQSNSANTTVGTPTGGRRVGTPLGRLGVSSGKERRESRIYNVTPINYVALSK